jgi:hypothetical protein
MSAFTCSSKVIVSLVGVDELTSVLDAVLVPTPNMSDSPGEAIWELPSIVVCGAISARLSPKSLKGPIKLEIDPFFKEDPALGI